MNNDLSPVVWRKSSRSNTNGDCVEVACLNDASWRKSSRSQNNGNCVEVACFNDASWRKSSRSSTNGQCVEAAVHASAIAIRDSKHCEGHDYPTLSVTPADWTGFLSTFTPRPTR